MHDMHEQLAARLRARGAYECSTIRHPEPPLTPRASRSVAIRTHTPEVYRAVAARILRDLEKVVRPK
jgi:hypothetical protein